MPYVGFDIGGSSVKAVLVKNRRIVASKKEKLPPNLKELLQFISKTTVDFAFRVRGNIGGIGFAFPGPLDLKREKILACPNIKYLRNQPIKKLLKRRLKYSIKIEHDVHAFLLAEKKVGAAKKLKNVFYLTLGTGLGGAFMVEGRIIKGSHGAAGEVGNTIIKLEIRNSKLKASNLEDLASNKFIKKSLGIGSVRAFELANKGDKKARKIFAELGTNLGIGIANIVNVFDPEAVILAGGLAGARKFIEPEIKKEIRRLVLSLNAQKTKILWSRLGDYGGALGAALLFEKE